ncbi:MAG: helix-turn-helix domain-containing protein [Clostridia bacterium]|nr:helix-turn-helix domain-containing protein [Clostridia bacterium]
MKNKTSNITTSGKRIKYEAMKRGYKTQDMANLLHYSDGHQISDFYRGKRFFDNDRLDIIAREFGLRKEYLLCIDDWETEADMLKALCLEDNSAFNSCKNYLDTLGLNLTLEIYFHISAIGLYDNWERFKDSIIDSEIQRLNAKYMFDLDRKAFFHKYNSDSETIKLRKPIDNTIENLDVIGKNTRIELECDLSGVHYIDNSFGCNAFYTIGYTVHYKDEKVSFLSLNQIQNFISQVDSFTICAIENILLKNRP